MSALKLIDTKVKVVKSDTVPNCVMIIKANKETMRPIHIGTNWLDDFIEALIDYKVKNKV